MRERENEKGSNRWDEKNGWWRRLVGLFVCLFCLLWYYFWPFVLFLIIPVTLLLSSTFLFSCYLVMVSGMACIATVACHHHRTAGMLNSEKVMSRPLPSSISEPSCSTLFTPSSNGYIYSFCYNHTLCSIVIICIKRGFTLKKYLKFMICLYGHPCEK